MTHSLPFNSASLSLSARNSSHVRRPTACSGVRLAPARNTRAALPGKPDRHDQPTPMTGPKVAAEQVGRAIHPRPTHVGYPARRLAESELDQLGRHLVGVDRLEA